MTLVIGDMPYESAGATANQKAVARVLDEVKESPDAGLADLIDWLNDLGPDDGPVAQAVLETLSGEVYTHVSNLGERRMHAFAGAVSRGLGTWLNAPDRAGGAGGAAERGGRLWAAAYSDAGKIAGGEGTAASSFNLSGLVAGADIVKTPALRIGLSAGGGASFLTMKDRASSLDGRGLDVGAYGRLAAGTTEITAVIAMGRGTYSARRTVQYGPESRRAEAEMSATGMAMTAEARFQPWPLSGFDVEPIASLHWFDGRRAAFEERGAGAAGLSVSEQSSSRLRGRVGLEAAFDEWEWGSAVVLPHARLALIADLSPMERTIGATLLGAPGVPFTVQGTRVQGSGLEVGFGIRSARVNNLGWGLDYAGEFRASQTDHAVRAHLSIAF